MEDISAVPDPTMGRSFLAMSALGEALSQHQQAFFADTTGDIARVACQVLAMLAKEDCTPSKDQTGLASYPSQVCLNDLLNRLFTASYCPDPLQFATTLDALERAGFSDDVLAYELIPSIARQLGKSWEDDLISFADVTIGCARLQSALHRLPDEILDVPVARREARPGCLVLVPHGAQHTLGALVLAKQLRQAQQRVTLELEADGTTLTRLAQHHRFDAVMISASRSECREGLGQMVRVARQNWPECKVVLGGSITDLKPDLITRIGADHVTDDWQEALDHCI